MLKLPDYYSLTSNIYTNITKCSQGIALHMIAINLDKVSVIYISEPIFENLSWEIHDNRVAGLIGPNGCGKSTLLKLINAEILPESGFISRKPGMSIGYLPQEPILDQENTLWDEVSKAHLELKYIETEITNIEKSLSQPEVYNDEKKFYACH